METRRYWIEIILNENFDKNGEKKFEIQNLFVLRAQNASNVIVMSSLFICFILWYKLCHVRSFTVS